jgi:hypothetical protein
VILGQKLRSSFSHPRALGRVEAPALLGGEDLDRVEVDLAVGGRGVDFDGGGLGGFEVKGAE